MERKLGPQEAAKVAGISVHTLRYYERAGLLERVERTPGGLRQYEDKDLGALEFIIKMRATGMGISQIRHYIQFNSLERSGLEKRRQMLVDHQNQLQAARRQLDECEAFLDYKLRFYDLALGKLESGEWVEEDLDGKWEEYFRTESWRKEK